MGAVKPRIEAVPHVLRGRDPVSGIVLSPILALSYFAHQLAHATLGFFVQAMHYGSSVESLNCQAVHLN